MTQEIRITGDLVQLVETTVQRVIPLKDWLPFIERRVPVSMPVLPESTRAVWWDPRGTTRYLIVMLEREPRIIHMNFLGRLHNLAIPWTRMAFLATTENEADDASWHLNDYKIFWAPARYSDPTKTDMTPARLPNVYRDGRICFGSAGVDANQSLANRLDQTLNEFYASQFNRDLEIRYPTPFTGFLTWASASAKNPLLWMSWPELALDSAGKIPSGIAWNDVLDDFSASADARDVPRVTPDPIPPLALMPSFGRTAEWLNTLTSHNIRTLRAALAIVPDATDLDEDIGEDIEEVFEEEDPR